MFYVVERGIFFLFRDRKIIDLADRDTGTHNFFQPFFAEKSAKKRDSERQLAMF